MTHQRSLLTVATLLLLAGAAVSADAQGRLLKPSSLADSMVKLPDGVSLYDTTAIWVDTASKYDMENNASFMIDSTQALLKGIRMTQGQMTQLDSLRSRYYTAAFAYFDKRPGNLSPDASRRRSGKFFQQMQMHDIGIIRALLTAEQRATFDARVKAREETAE